MALNNTLQLFDEVVNLTNGGPGNATRTISEYIYDLSFVYAELWLCSGCFLCCTLILIIILTIVQKGMTGEKK